MPSIAPKQQSIDSLDNLKNEREKGLTIDCRHKDTDCNNMMVHG